MVSQQAPYHIVPQGAEAMTHIPPFSGDRECPRATSLGRRRFLAGLSALATAPTLAAAADSAPQPSGNAAPESPGAPLPTIALGKHRISRLVVGSNPILGYSYMGPHTDQHMREYFTTERTVEFLKRCEREGITAHQFSTPDRRIESLRLLREGGSKMHLICLHANRSKVKTTVEDSQPIAMVHHGGVTDQLYAEGKFQQVRDYVKAVRDCGVLAGVSAHNPDCIRRIADEGWEVDFFMTCFYFLTRKHGPAKHGNGNKDGKGDNDGPPPTLEITCPFYRNDPDAMTEVIRKVKQPCLGFKILAAGRRCGDQASVRAAFEYAFARIKPTDGVIVGMYPRFFDEIHANAQYVREFGRARAT
jgi:hypothetical protein